jgi:curli biogenesis system outer membrane secretion channel CsgG
MHIMKSGLSLLALALVVIASAPSSYAQPTRGKRTTSADAARAAATRECSTSGFKSAKEYNSSAIPWYTYSNCMTDRGHRP